MPHDYDLDQLQRKLGRLEQELAEARRQLERLTTAREGSPAAPTAVPVAEPPLLPPVLPPVAPPPAGLPVATPPPPAGGLRPWLEGIGLWPPRGDADVEARLGAWWATRLGALLAVIGVVFFGIYVSRNTPPVVKLAELVLIAGVAFGAGLWLGRRWPRFGPVVAGAGIALLYFAAFAAYAVPATQVFLTPLPSAIAQLAVTGAALAFAAGRRSETMGAMALGLGYVTAFFAGYVGLEQFASWSALILAAGAAGLRLQPGWRSPLVVALPLAYGVLTVQGLAVWTGLAPTAAALWLPFLAAFAIFLLPDALAAARGRELAHDDRVMQNLNAGVAVAAGFIVTLRVLPGELAAFWFWSGGLMLVLAVFWWWRSQPGSLVPVAACKASSLLALGVITEYEGHLRWLVLLLQAFVLLTAARVTEVRGLRTMTRVVWALAVLLLAHSLLGGGALPSAATVIFLALAAVLLALDERWLGAPRVFSFLAGAFLGAAAGYAVRNIAPAGWLPAAFMGVALLLGIVGGLSRGWRGPAVAAGFLFLAAHLAMLAFPVHQFSVDWLWLNEAVLLAGALATGFGLTRWAARLDEAGLGRILRFGVTFLAILVLQRVLFAGLAKGEALAATVGVALALMAVCPRLPPWPLVPGLAFGLVLGWVQHRPFKVRVDDTWLLLAATAAWVLPVVWHLSSRRQELLGTAPQRRFVGWLLTGLATWFSLQALRANFTGPALPAAVAVEALAVFVLGWRLGLHPAFAAASVLLLAGAGWLALALAGAAGWLVRPDLAATGAVVLLAAVALALPVVGRDRPETDAPRWRTWARWLHAIGALGLLFWVAVERRDALAPYATVLWGGVAIAIFVAGLFARERAYRLTGLAGLALCVPRMFFVDLDSTLHRIVAFVVLGLVLLWVGFSYHRFRHLIARPDRPDGPSAKPD